MFGGIFGGGGLFNFVSQIALASVTGGASLAMQAVIQQLTATIIQNAIAQVGQQLGLPPAFINAAQTAFASNFAGGLNQAGGANQSVSDILSGNGINASPFQAGALTGAVDDVTNSIVEMMLDTIRNEGERRSQEGADEARNRANGGANGDLAGEFGISGGILVQLAALLGEALDKKTQQMIQLGEAINGAADAQSAFGEITADNTADFQALNTRIQGMSALLQGVAKELEVLSNALNTTLNSVGDSQATLARDG